MSGELQGDCVISVDQLHNSTSLMTLFMQYGSFNRQVECRDRQNIAPVLGLSAEDDSCHMCGVRSDRSFPLCCV